jgi:hypothetical protein
MDKIGRQVYGRGKGQTYTRVRRSVCAVLVETEKSGLDCVSSVALDRLRSRIVRTVLEHRIGGAK